MTKLEISDWTWNKVKSIVAYLIEVKWVSLWAFSHVLRFIISPKRILSLEFKQEPSTILNILSTFDYKWLIKLYYKRAKHRSLTLFADVRSCSEIQSKYAMKHVYF